VRREARVTGERVQTDAAGRLEVPGGGTGTEWLVEATGCDPARLKSPDALAALFDEIVRDLGLHVVGTPAWHVFPDPGGITGVYLLAESHLAIHTFPEYGSVCLNLFCCRARPAWDFEAGLARHLGATEVSVRVVERDYLPSAAAV
jgi:S-adenosylmethionine decarboxylase